MTAASPPPAPDLRAPSLTCRFAPSPPTSATIRTFVRDVLVVLAAFVATAASGQVHVMDAAPSGTVEAGMPQFLIRGSDALGLTSAPTDLHVMPDGRVLLLGPRQLALGDGSRWEVLAQSESDAMLPATQVAVDAAGEIYAAATRGFARLVFLPNGTWVARVVTEWPATETATLRTCVQLEREWVWHSNSGPVFAWQPGAHPRKLGHGASIGHVFSLGGDIYYSDRASGALWRAGTDEPEPVPYVEPLSIRETITCSAAFGDKLIVGTHGHGLRIFDGRTTRPFATSGLLASQARINDVCSLGSGLFAAAIDGRGIVFFDATGRLLQSIDRTSDHRLAQVRRLAATPGIVWALLADGVAQVQFPSRFSYFEPLIGTGTTAAHPLRYRGDLWLLADGYVRKGIYDPGRRLADLQVDTPAGGFATNTTVVGDWLVTASDHGAYYRRGDEWVCFAPEINHLRVLEHAVVDGRWLFAATGVIGWLRPTVDGLQVETFPEPRLRRAFDSQGDADGTVWLELGDGAIGRIRLEGSRPRLEIFGPEAGLPENWAQLFQFDGRVRFNVGDRILRFDAPTRRFVADEEFSRSFPELPVIIGRPGRDSLGRYWITTPRGVRLFERANGRWRALPARFPPGLLPYNFTFERGGVVWMHGDKKLVRYDASLPDTTQAPLDAIITRVVFTATGRNVYHPGAVLPSLSFAENSIDIHFAAPGHALQPVTFEVSMAGDRSEWVSVGSAGSAMFNGLREGRYVVRVRPRIGEVLGAEASLQVTVNPPWFRTPSAYLAYWFCGVALVLASGRVFSFFQRRENARLERLVAERTHELNASNERLAGQVEEIRTLSQAIEQSPVATLITDRAGRIVYANPRAHALCGRPAGQLTGTDLRSFRASSTPPKTLEEIEASVRRGESWDGQLINQHADGRLVHVHSTVAPVRGGQGEIRHLLVLDEDLTEAISENERRQRLEAQLLRAQKLESLGTLAGGIAHDFNNILTAILGFCELAEMSGEGNAALQQDLTGIRTAGLRAKDLVARILAFSRQSRSSFETIDLSVAIADAMNLVRASAPSTIAIGITSESATIRADATQIQQVVLNLCTNSIHAIGAKPGRIAVAVEPVEVDAQLAGEVANLWVGPGIRLTVTDTGGGIDEAMLDRIFDPFFTTKPLGEGTGLGLAIVQSVVVAHGAALRVRSTVGVGTTFEIYFRRSEDRPAIATSDAPVPRGRNERVMVVDDEPAVANFVSARLGQLGYRPVAFPAPTLALESFLAQPDRFEAVVTDLTMPGLTGVDLVQQIRAAGRAVPAVIITGYSNEAAHSRIQDLPRCLVLLKPFSGDDLGRALRQVLDDGCQPAA